MAIWTFWVGWSTGLFGHNSCGLIGHLVHITIWLICPFWLFDCLFNWAILPIWPFGTLDHLAILADNMVIWLLVINDLEIWAIWLFCHLSYPALWPFGQLGHLGLLAIWSFRAVGNLTNLLHSHLNHLTTLPFGYWFVWPFLGLFRRLAIWGCWPFEPFGLFSNLVIWSFSHLANFHLTIWAICHLVIWLLVLFGNKFDNWSHMSSWLIKPFGFHLVT